MSNIRVLLVEDQTLMRDGLRTILELSGGFEVVGEAENGRHAVDLALQLKPDVILMDVKLPELDGIKATALVTQVLAATKVILLTTFDIDEYVFTGIEAGAQGYLLKETPATELIDVIHRVHTGENVIQPDLASRLIFAMSQRRSVLNTAGNTNDLTEREAEVLRLMADGWSNKAIAERLVLTEGTIKNYVSIILDKLRATNRTHAVTIARQQGLLQ